LDKDITNGKIIVILMVFNQFVPSKPLEIASFSVYKVFHNVSGCRESVVEAVRMFSEQQQCLQS
jgi:hypothetical protein